MRRGNDHVWKSPSEVNLTRPSRLRAPLMQDPEQRPSGSKRAALRKFFMRVFRPKKYARQQLAAKAEEERLAELREREAGLEAARQKIQRAAEEKIAREEAELREQKKREEEKEIKRQRFQKAEEQKQKELEERLAQQDPDAARKQALQGVVDSATASERAAKQAIEDEKAQQYRLQLEREYNERDRKYREEEENNYTLYMERRIEAGSA